MVDLVPRTENNPCLQSSIQRATAVQDSATQGRRNTSMNDDLYISSGRCTIRQGVVPLTAHSILEQSLSTIGQRGQEYDQPQGERSMELTVQLFNAYTGRDLSTAEGWQFMIFLKLARIKIKPDKLDSHVDLAGYVSLAGEECLKAKTNETVK